MGYPQVSDKYGDPTYVIHSGLFPDKFLSFISDCNLLVIFFDRGLFTHVSKKFKGRSFSGCFGDFVKLRRRSHICCVSGFGVGGSSLASLMEYYRQAGFDRFLLIGIAGLFWWSDFGVGDILFPVRSVRDEGVSYHYLKSSTFVDRPSGSLFSSSRALLSELGFDIQEGINVSTDAPFRVTASELRYYEMLNAGSIEMELSSFYAVGQYYGLDVCGVLVGSDMILSDGQVERSASLVRERLELCAEGLISNL